MKKKCKTYYRKRHKNSYKKHNTYKNLETYVASPSDSYLISKRFSQFYFNWEKIEITQDMGMDEVVLHLANNNPDAFVILTHILYSYTGACLDIIFLWDLELYGDKITTFFERYCNCCFNCFLDRVHFFRINNFSKEQVYNLTMRFYEALSYEHEIMN